MPKNNTELRYYDSSYPKIVFVFLFFLYIHTINIDSNFTSELYNMNEINDFFYELDILQAARTIFKRAYKFLSKDSFAPDHT